MRIERVKFNQSALRGKIVEKYGSIDSFSKYLGRSRQSTQYIISGHTDMTRSTMIKWAEALGIKLDSPEMIRIFLQPLI